MTVEPIYITWLNHLGGFEYFPFTGEKQNDVDIMESGQVRQNIFPGWGNSYGQTADTIDKQTFTKAKNSIVVRSQHLTLNQLHAVSFIKISAVVQIVYSRNDRRTVLVDKDSFKKYDESEKLFTFQFRAIYTDDIAVQRL